MVSGKAQLEEALGANEKQTLYISRLKGRDRQGNLTTCSSDTLRDTFLTLISNRFEVSFAR